MIQKLENGKKRCDPSEIIHGKEFKHRKNKLKKWHSDRIK